MGDGTVDYRTNKRFPVRCLLLISTLALFGCSSAPDILPVGAPEMAKRDGIRRVVAYADFPVLVTKTPGQEEKSLQISVTWRGKWLWWKHMPFGAANGARFTLRHPDGGSLCTVEIMNTGNETDSPNCTFEKGNVLDYASRPLVGELTYWFGDNKEPEDEPVMRTYYVISQAQPTEPPKQMGTAK